MESVWRKRLAEYGRGGETVSSFCERHGVSTQSFYRWKGELARRDREAGLSSGDAAFAEMSVIPVPVAAEGGDAIEVVLPGAWRVRVLPGFDADTLSRVLDALAGRPC